MGAGNEGDTSESAITKVKGVFVGDELKATVKMPAQVLLIEAIMRDRDYRQMGMGARLMSVLGDAGKAANDPKNVLQIFLKTYKTDPKGWKETREADYIDKELVRLIETGAPEEQILARIKRGQYDSDIAGCVGSQSGWEVSPMDVAKKVQTQRYMEFIATSCDFANTVFTELVAAVGDKTMKDPDAAKEKIRNAWNSIPEAKLDAAWESAKQANAGKDFGADLTGVQGIKFQGPNSQYWNQGTGFVVEKNGVKWFGDGRISGTEAVFPLASSISTKG